MEGANRFCEVPPYRFTISQMCTAESRRLTAASSKVNAQAHSYLKLKMQIAFSCFASRYT